jgi:hypothetical protein
MTGFQAMKRAEHDSAWNEDPQIRRALLQQVGEIGHRLSGLH